MSSRLATPDLYFTGRPKLARRDQFWLGPGPILAAKVVRGTNFGKIFCQNWSGRTDFGVTGQKHEQKHYIMVS